MRMEPKYVKRRQRGLAVLVAALVLLVSAVVYIGVNMNSGKSDFEGQGNGTTVLVEVPEGSSMSQLGPDLESKGVVADADTFASAAYSNKAAAELKPGFYKLQEQMSAKSAVNALLSDDNRVEMLDIPGGATLMDVKVVAGDTRFGIYSMISQVSCGQPEGNCISTEELQRVGATADLQELGVPDWAIEPVQARGDDPRRLEGLIVPGQYVVDPTADALSVLKDLISRSAKSYADTDLVNRSKAVGLSPYEMVTAASLVEREAPEGDFNKVARVILNRLEEPQRLEFDSTVNYDLSEQEVATTNEDRARETPWNTYAMDGLPATPIASPSIQAIEAMENPAEGDWLYFVTVDKDGTTVFTRNFDEHQEATKESLDNGVLDSNR
ncbi:endolytic transglycosylase MltG [Corynebacterium pelargi]|uniref:Endolytic murein transglycosylase n=1 Tax=Corynebacterium pelargi TaxID=1471400 RepID=A0A410W8L5_9CORY|nr:endolytic transglycosylase MltG [Corynebacterium pelargi]QAU52286.1 putative aminodeoxychorismate lyase [Corynebacterium pelargi]GGG68781.1 ABC transporter substrate-binding protein [Corynebacterium pelargi]